jgi:hypothetical protein
LRTSKFERAGHRHSFHHIDTAADDLVMDAIRLSNEMRPLLRKHYFITNMANPDKETIQKYLKEYAQ